MAWGYRGGAAAQLQGISTSALNTGEYRTQSFRIHNVNGRMTDEQLMGKDLEGSGHGLMYVVLHAFLNGLCSVCSGGDANWTSTFRGPALHEAARWSSRAQQQYTLKHSDPQIYAARSQPLCFPSNNAFTCNESSTAFDTELLVNHHVGWCCKNSYGRLF